MQHSVAYDNHTFDKRQFTLNIRRCTQRSVRDDSYTFESRQFTFNTKKCTQHLEADDDHIFYTRQFTFLQQIIHSQQQTMQFSIAADNSRSKPYIIYLIIDGRFSFAYQCIKLYFQKKFEQPTKFILQQTQWQKLCRRSSLYSFIVFSCKSREINIYMKL